jgi:hypothetical protein
LSVQHVCFARAAAHDSESLGAATKVTVAIAASDFSFSRRPTGKQPARHYPGGLLLSA